MVIRRWETFDILARHDKLKAYTDKLKAYTDKLKAYTDKLEAYTDKLKAYTDKLKFDNVLKKKEQYTLQFWLIIYLKIS